MPPLSDLVRRMRGASTMLLLGIALATSGAGASAVGPEGRPEGWQGLLGDRPAALLGDRWVVVLEAQSLADRVRQAGGVADEAQMTSWTRTAGRVQRAFLTRLAELGVFIQPEFSYTRVFNGFAASMDASAVARIEAQRGVAGVYPVRAAFPAAIGVQPGAGGRPARAALPGFDGAGVTIALLDTGVDPTHPFIRRNLLGGIDIVDPGGGAVAHQHPTIPGRPERHGTALAGILVGSDGPAGLTGVAPGASVLPIRVAGWQPDAAGDVAVYGRTDQVLAGLEAAVDPNGDGATHDAARVAVVGVVEPFGAFADGPLARAVDGAVTLDMLVVAPAGNDGPAGPAFGSIAAPGGAAASLSVAAADLRERSPSAHVLIRSGLGVVVSGEQPLGGAVGPDTAVTLPVRMLPPATIGGLGGLPSYFDRNGYSRVAGAAALLPSGVSSPEAVREAAVAGAGAILIDGVLPAGVLSLAEAPAVPVLGLEPEVARAIRLVIRSGAPVTASIGAVQLAGNSQAADVAPFSSRGLAFDGGAKPDLAAPGVGVATSEPGRGEAGIARYGTISGSSVAAAVTGGTAAVLAQARPDLDAAGLRGALVAGARPLATEPGAAGTGLVDAGAASASELIANPVSTAFPPVLEVGKPVRTTVTLRNVSRRRLVVRLSVVDTPGQDAEIRINRLRVRLSPGGSTTVGLRATLPRLPTTPAAIRGVVVARVEGGGRLRIPWVAPVRDPELPLVSAARLVSNGKRPTDREPWLLRFVAGRVDGTTERPQVSAVSLLELQLYRGTRQVGIVARLRDVLPGRYRFGLTGRGPRGARLPRGAYELRIVAHPTTAGEPTTAIVPFSIP